MHLLERQTQLDILNRCLQDAHANGGKLVLVSAEAGFGKSALVERFSLEHKTSVRTLWGSCDALATPRALAPILEIAAQTSAVANTSASDSVSRDGLFQALFAELSRPEKSWVVVLEDLHWADEATLDFMRFIGRRIQRTTSIFIATYRDDEFSAGHPVRLALGELTGDHVLRMRLPPLSLRAVETLARESGRDPLRLHEITGGNPFFVREVLAADGDSVPETVRDAVLKRLSRCPGATRDLVELVSMSPSKCENWLLESVFGSFQEALDEASRRGLLVMYGDAIGFRHELARLAVHDTIAPLQARVLHERVVRGLISHGADLPRLVHHAARAHNVAAVLEYAPSAAEESAQLGAHREAAAFFREALRHRVLLTTVVQAGYFERHAQECSLANLTLEAIGSANAAAAAWHELGEIEAHARVLNFLSQEYRNVGNKQKADDCVAQGIALLEARAPGVHLAMAYSARALLAVNRGWDKETLEYGGRALELARRHADPVTETHALCSLGSALLGTGNAAGYEMLLESLEIALRHDLEDHAARAYRSLLFYAVLLHDFVRADQLYAAGVAYCDERGIFSHSVYMRAYYTPCELERGRWTEAARLASDLLGSSEANGVQQRITLLVTIAVVRLRRGDPGVDALLEEASILALPTSELNRIGRVAAARAEHAWLRGELGRVASEAATGLKYLHGHTAPWIKGELVFWLSRGQAVDPIPQDIAEPYRLMLIGDWRGAAQSWEALGMPYEQALALVEGPGEMPRESLAILSRLGGEPLATIARRRLRERGVRGVQRGPNESTRSNSAGLTAREIEVLSLLARGGSNAQLARKLHRSTKTIDHHVSAILEKLGVRSRTEAVTSALAMNLIRPPGQSEKSMPRADD